MVESVNHTSAGSSRKPAMYSGSDDTTIKVWDVQTLKCVKTLEGHEDNVRVLAVGDRYMFSGSWDKTIRVWDINTLDCVRVLEGHTEAVLALAVELRSWQVTAATNGDRDLAVFEAAREGAQPICPPQWKRKAALALCRPQIAAVRM